MPRLLEQVATDFRGASSDFVEVFSPGGDVGSDVPAFTSTKNEELSAARRRIRLPRRRTRCSAEACPSQASLCPR